MLKRETNKRKYLNKKSYLNRRLQQDVMENGIAYIPCKVSGIDEVISKYSVKGCESLEPEFMDYITSFVDFIPLECPVVLEITAEKFSLEEEETIRETILSEMAYLNGKTEVFLRNKRRRFYGMIIGTIISGIILSIAKMSFYPLPPELFYVVFWLFSDAFVRYLFIDNLDFREEKIRMGRLASMKVEFNSVEETPESEC